MYVIVCYDITNNSRRARLHELLLGYGTPVQKSVFECSLTPAQFGKLRLRARPFARKTGESIRYYQMCGKCQSHTKSYGIPLVESEKKGDFII